MSNFRLLSCYPWIQGISKFQIREMGSRYPFIIFYCYLEARLSRQDYKNRLDLRETQLQVWSR
jgi:hypothetical protein